MKKWYMMTPAASFFFAIIELTILSFLILGCDSKSIPTDQCLANGSTTINSYIKDSVFTCPDNPCLSDTSSLNQLYFKLLPERLKDNTVAAPLPILSVLTMLTGNATDTKLIGLRSKVPCSFLKTESAIRQNCSWHNGVTMESIFWGQSDYFFSSDFLNAVSLCGGEAGLKTAEFLRSRYDFSDTLNSYLHSFSDTFDYIPFYKQDKIDSVRGVFTSTFCVNTSFDSSIVEDMNYEGIFRNESGSTVVTNGIRFKKGLKTYKDSTYSIYQIALNDTSLLMYVFTGIDTCFQSPIQKVLDMQVPFLTDTTTQLWLPYVSIKHEIGVAWKYTDNFYDYFSIPVNDTLIDYRYINHNGALSLSSITSSAFFSLSSKLTVVSNAAVWLRATSKENRSNWDYLGVGIDADCYYNSNITLVIKTDSITDYKPFVALLVHKMTNSVLSVAFITTVSDMP